MRRRWRRRIAIEYDHDFGLERATDHGELGAGCKLCERRVHERDRVRAGNVHVPDDRWRAGGYRVLRTSIAFVGTHDLVAATDEFQWQSNCGMSSIRKRACVGTGTERGHSDGG